MAQDWTDDCFDAGHVAQEDMANIEKNLLCLKGLFSGASAPSNPVAGLLWLDTTNHLLMMRNEANNAWLTVYDLANQYVLSCSRQIIAGTGLTGGGVLSADRTLGISAGGVGATQLADGGVSQTKLATYTAGDLLLISGNTTVVISSSNQKLYEIRLDRPGTLRIKFIVVAGGASGSSTGRIYRNGSAVGTTRTVNAPGGANITTTEYSQDISGWASGDLVQLYGYSNSSLAGSVGGFRLYTGNWYTLEDMVP